MNADLEKHLLFRPRRPIPLPDDFYKRIVDRNPPEDMELNSMFQIETSRNNEEEISKIAEEIVGKNEPAITEAAKRLAASSCPTPNGPMFSNLVPVDFNEVEFVQQIENNLQRQRQEANRSAR